MMSRLPGSALACLPLATAVAAAAGLGMAVAHAASPPSLPVPASSYYSTTVARLAGRLEWTQHLQQRWPFCGAWIYPVGDSLDYTRPYHGRPAYQVSRNVQTEAEGDRHSGADMLNGRGGGTVRAAAHGVVVFVAKGTINGYGHHVVIAHRFEDGSFAYSVYAHLASGTIRVRPAQIVRAGTRLGRVGRTGRATTNHLHFEVRRPDDPNRRWEDTSPVDPLAFIEERRVPAYDGTLAAYQSWAAMSALMDSTVDVNQPLDGPTWERMRARGMGLGWSDEEAGEVPRASGRVSWKELAKDLRTMNDEGPALAPVGVSSQRHLARCRDRFGVSQPALATRKLEKFEGSPTVADACVLLADLMVPPPEKSPSEESSKAVASDAQADSSAADATTTAAVSPPSSSRTSRKKSLAALDSTRTATGTAAAASPAPSGKTSKKKSVAALDSTRTATTTAAASPAPSGKTSKKKSLAALDSTRTATGTAAAASPAPSGKKSKKKSVAARDTTRAATSAVP